MLRGISFDVPAGTVTAVIGPSGSGKTTVLRTLNALDQADAGVITIGDVSVDFAGPRTGPRWPASGPRAGWSFRATTCSRT